ncbi:MAG: hypothetical protein KJ970_02415 [Candidatus Eisenbacteria bacterium]|uniref:Uncharacterized protein n=1 Tax=Eiseniibacteriota bacterium TaxID=2212470 RepID=A0A948W2B0_UNCEI|nr:hypothetical protein [Candidatus Eisenbacteria bacterium]MBU1950869.1 hypothetical protein [Candidatus Eisenbacteria bacterium]MBU2689752.1 hypothetical protein [Candidatus Eisenbacteria bacterium]
MTPNERKKAWKRIQDLYHAARELQEDARAQFLAYQCAGDKNTRVKVERLLAATENCSFLADSFDEAES